MKMMMVSMKCTSSSHVWVVIVINQQDKGFRKKDDQEFYDKQGTLSNGNVHWVVSREQRSITHVTILFYNLGEEMVGRIAVPPASEGNHIEDYDLGEIDGCFSALRFLDYKGERVWG